MMNRKSISLMIVTAILLSACGSSPTVTPTTEATGQITYLPTIVTPTPVVTPATEIPVVIPSPAETTSQAGSELPDISSAVYLDDRSTAASLMLSYFNAVNRQEYLRAYSYYGNTADLGTLEEFSNGYAETESVNVVFGQISGEGAAGSLYYTVPMVLNAATSTGEQQKFASCYVLRLPQPGNYGAPPISPMHIERGTAAVVPLSTSDEDALADACPAPDFPTGPHATTAVVEDLSDVSSANYIDNRSDAAAVMSSFVNAINRKEYVRAFSYWQTAPSTYEDFAAGYSLTTQITAQFGETISDPGAGQIYYSLPVAMRATQMDGSVKTYAGCYVMHIAQPSVQATPPFQPLGIVSADVKLVDNSAELESLVDGACK